MLDVGRLRLLLAISEHGGTAGAARALGRPVTEVSTQVTDASQELGLALLDGDRLTPAGRRLAEHGARLLGQLEAAESDAAAVAGRLAGTLRLGVGADAGRALLADALPALRSAAPDLSVHVRQLADERVDALGSTLDVVVAGEYGAAVPHRADAAVERRELFTEPLLLAVPTRHRATGASVRLAELAGEAWIGGAGDALVALERAAAGAGFAPRLVAEVGEDALALTLVAAGQGVALVPASATPAPVDGVRFLTVLDGGLRRTVVAAVRRSAVADPGVRRLLEALAAAARRVAAAVPGVSAAAVSSPPPPSSAAQGAGGRRPDPLLDPLPETPPSARNGRRDPWADRMRPETNGSSHGGPGTSRNGYGGPGETPGRNGHSFPSDLSGLSGLAGRNGGADPLGGFGPPADPLPGSDASDLPDLPGRNGFGGSGPDGPRGGGATRFGAPDAPEPPRRAERDAGFGSLPAPGEPAGRPGFGGPADPPRSGHDISDRAASSTFGPADLSGPGALPGPGGVSGPGALPGPLPAPGETPFGGDRRGADFPAPGETPFGTDRRGAEFSAPGETPFGTDRRGAEFSAPGETPFGTDRPVRGAEFGDRGRHTGPADFGSPPPAGDRPDFTSLPPAGDRPERGPADFGSVPPGGGRADRRPADFGSLPPAGERGPADFGSLPPAGGRADRGPADFGSLPPAGERADRGRADFGSSPAAGGRGPADFGASPAAGNVPGPRSERGDGPVLPPPGADLPTRGGASPYRTPPPTGDLPPAEMARFGNELGPNPYRPDTSAHPAPDPFRAGGPDQGPNPYRSNGGRRGDSLGGVELFSATPRNGAPEVPPAPRSAPSRLSRPRGGDGADGTLPPAPAGTPPAPASIFDDLRSEWFVQRDDSAPKNPTWQMAADDGWAAAARLSEPTTAGTTTAGLPRRRPQAMAVPGAVGGQTGSDTPPPSTTHRSPQEVRGRLSSYRDGVRRGRHAERADGEDQ